MRLPVQGGRVRDKSKRELCMSASSLVGVAAASTASARATTTLSAMSAPVAPGPFISLSSFGMKVVALRRIVIVLIAVGAELDDVGDNARIASVGPWLNMEFGFAASDERQRALLGMLVGPWDQAC